jgi:hypothetical protein
MTAIAPQAGAQVTPAARFALLTALEAAIKAEKEPLKAELIAQARATDATGFNSPFGKISITQPQASVSVSDESAFVDYIEETLPNAIQTIKIAAEWARASLLDRLVYVESGVLVNGAYVPDATVMAVQPDPDADPDAPEEVVVFAVDGTPLDDAVVKSFFVDPSTDRVLDFVALKPAGDAYPAFPSSPNKKAAVAAARDFLSGAAPQLVDAVKELTA